MLKAQLIGCWQHYQNMHFSVKIPLLHWFAFILCQTALFVSFLLAMPCFQGIRRQCVKRKTVTAIKLTTCPYHTANNACAWLPASSAPLWLWPAAPDSTTVHPASSGAKPACRSSPKNPPSWIPAFCSCYQQGGKDYLLCAHLGIH